MRVDEYAAHDAIGLRGLLDAGEVSTDEVEAAARRALDAADAAVNGLAAPAFSPALDHATDGPLSGVPFLIKDFGPMARGVPFFCGSRALVRVVAHRDSDLMTRIRAAGLVTLGLTTAPELALGFATEPLRSGVTRNPWDLERGAGGSSGGAAALVAAGAVPIAHGNDGAGSIRVPASCCGLVGLKPSRGRTPSGPDIGEGVIGLTEQGGLTRSVRDAAHYLDAVHGPSRRRQARRAAAGAVLRGRARPRAGPTPRRVDHRCLVGRGGRSRDRRGDTSGRAPARGRGSRRRRGTSGRRLGGGDRRHARRACSSPPSRS